MTLPPKTSIERDDKPMIERRAQYADFPACLPRYKWLVEEALRSDHSKMFNASTLNNLDSYCKVCGAAHTRKEWAAHVKEHAKQLGLNVTGGKGRSTPVSAPAQDVQLKIEEPEEPLFEPGEVEKHPLWGDIVATIKDTLIEKSDGLVFKNDIDVLAGMLASAMLNDITEDSAGDLPICEDCN